MSFGRKYCSWYLLVAIVAASPGCVNDFGSRDSSLPGPIARGSDPSEQAVSLRLIAAEVPGPKVQLHVTGPNSSPPSSIVPVKVLLANIGAVDSREISVRVALSDGATLERSEPPPNRQDGSTLVFDLPALSAGQSKTIVLQVRPAKVGQVTVSAEATTADGYQARHETTTRIDLGRLQAVLEVEPVALTSAPIAVRIAVTNSGAARIENVTAWAQFDTALAHASGKNPVELAVGALAPGETRTLDLPLTTKKTGRYSVRANLTADGGLSAAPDPVIVDVHRAELAVAVSGPTLAYVNQDFTWTIAVVNQGDSPISDLSIRATLPPEAKLRDAGDGRLGTGTVEWRFSELTAGEKQTVNLRMEAAALSDRAAVTVAVLGDVLSGPAGNGRPVGDPVQARGEAALAIIGSPALVLELATPAGPVEIGKRVSFTVRVRNRGSVVARNVDVIATSPSQLKVFRGTGPTETRIDPAGKVTFATLDEILPGKTASFTIEVDAIHAGEARFLAEVRAAHLNSALREEQSTRVVGR